jgi:hypothetical protein
MAEYILARASETDRNVEEGESGGVEEEGGSEGDFG